MVGDGLSIDPTDAVLVAGCDGEVVALHAAGHAVTIQTAEGIDVLMHVGIDTVNLKGEGFHPRVGIGDKVRTGTPLIEFDLDFVATHAKSLLTQVIITSDERVTAWQRANGLVTAGKDALFTITVAQDVARESTDSTKTITSPAIVIPNPTGLHARPAVVLANAATSSVSTPALHDCV